MAMETQAHSSATAQVDVSVDPVVIKLGKKKRRDIRQLSKGKGRLFARVVETHAHLRSEGAADGPVIVVVKKKNRRAGKWFGIGRPWM